MGGVSSQLDICLPITPPPPSGMASLSGPGAGSSSWPPSHSFSSYGPWPPSRAWAWGGTGTACKRVGSGDRHASPGPLCHVFSPLHPSCCPREVCPGPSSQPPPGRQEARTREAGSGAESQSEVGGSLPQAHSIQELPDTHVLNSLSQVRERDLPFVTHTLSSEFTILRVVNGETVAAENLGITNGFVKPKMGESEGRRVGAG